MNVRDKFLLGMFSALKINLMGLAYKGLGISSDFEALNANFFNVILPRYMNKDNPLTFFDVGANIGDVTKQLLHCFPNSSVHSFEPNPNTYKQLYQAIKSDRAVLAQTALGEKITDATIYFPSHAKSSGHASMFKDVFQDADNMNLEAQPIKVDTIDNYCAKHGIKKIDFLKIDTEGNEYAVLKGGSEMIKNGRIPLVQFEFNEMNIASRVFMKDFYELLHNYVFYRIKEDKLFPMGAYTTSHEIFRIQNILAVKKTISV